MRSIPPVKTDLTEKQKNRINALVIKKKNLNRACAFAGINTRTLKLAVLKRGPIRSDQRDAVLQFCDMVEGKPQKSAA